MFRALFPVPSVESQGLLELLLLTIAPPPWCSPFSILLGGAASALASAPALFASAAITIGVLVVLVVVILAVRPALLLIIIIDGAPLALGTAGTACATSSLLLSLASVHVGAVVVLIAGVQKARHGLHGVVIVLLQQLRNQRGARVIHGHGRLHGPQQFSTTLPVPALPSLRRLGSQLLLRASDGWKGSSRGRSSMELLRISFEFESQSAGIIDGMNE
mmetsp:Transcript_6951/g.12316  ORF Transcript_6951/g.12316 Transcript_6951/m.12316 type:complete len:218 (-) Transcript_6951:138-791(-)